MKRVFNLFGKEFNLPWLDRMGKAIRSFSFTEKVIFGVFTVIFVLSSLLIILKVNTQFLIEVPRFGGVLKEGVIGTPRFINPILSISETDRDLSSLVYSGLMRITPDGKLIPDLALDYTISEDGREYVFTIRGDAVFHDGESVTADDVAFTIKQAKNPSIKSPQRANWEGVTVEKISDNQVLFVLPQPYSPFPSNTTIGILPEHIWKDVSDEEFPFTQRNVNPIGSGPYKISNTKRNSSGIAERYELESFNNFTLGKPYIKNITFNFYRNETELLAALGSGNIDSINSISPHSAKQLEKDGFRVIKSPLPRIFGVFFNQSQAPVLASKTVRSALNAAIDREAIVEEVLAGYGSASTGPIPDSLIPFETIKGNLKESELSPTEKAVQILSDGGFKMNESGFMERETKEGLDLLTITISTANVPELVSVAEKIVSSWKAAGIDVTLKVFDPNDFNQNIIRPRKYDAILFGEIIGRDLDFYAFWHSSQRNDPGLNIADYANIDVDSALEDARTLEDTSDKIEELRTFVSEVEKDVPAAFIYSPDFIYVVPKNIKGDVPKNISTPSERFLSVYDWYLETDTVWKIFHTSN